jgi:hypothetical protein
VLNNQYREIISETCLVLLNKLLLRWSLLYRLLTTLRNEISDNLEIYLESIIHDLNLSLQVIILLIIVVGSKNRSTGRQNHKKLSNEKIPSNESSLRSLAW